jgi:poly-gamma-glutamate synthesis protein (capsule biosynthesis protein)
VLVTANNHSLDRRRKGLERTIRVLDSLHLYHTGTFRDTVERLNDYPLFLEKNGITLALLNYTFGTNGIPVTAPNVVNLIDTAIIARDLQRAKQLQPDVIVVFMHWGKEYQHQPAAAQQRLAEFCFQRGANIVVGAQPHVLQPMYWYRQKNSVLAYSLGNFISGQRDHPRDGAASLFIEISKVYSTDTCYALITDARYLLHWVYSTPLPQRKFVVLPVPDFETNTHYIADEASLTAFHKFITHARALLAVRNNRIPEINGPIPDSIVRYQVVWRVPAFRADTIRLAQADKVFGLYRHPEADNQVRFETGTFKTYTAALHYWQRIRRRYPEAVIQKQVLK